MQAIFSKNGLHLLFLVRAKGQSTRCTKFEVGTRIMISHPQHSLGMTNPVIIK